MVFTSVQYMLFLPCVTLAYWLLPLKARWPLLLAASYFFYAFVTPSFAIWLAVVTAITYLGGVLLDKYAEKKRKKWILFFSAGIVLGILFVFKYLNFTIEQINAVLGWSGSQTALSSVSLVMPLGLSFFTFQALGYLFDVAKGKRPAEKHLGKYALFIAFFPHLSQGPIDRSDHLLPQLHERHSFDPEMATHGLVLILFGVFKKIVIADRLALLVNEVFNNVGAYSGQAFWLGSIFYTFQIYCDFSGYTDIALGSAELLGYRLQENFKRPYLATSVADFWRRWHLSLSRWFRDYLYIPLGGNRVSAARWALNVMIVFAVSGIWHGAAWTFIIWGLLHGFFQIVGKFKTEKITSRIVKKDSWLIHGLRVCVTFFLINLLWIVFRANSLQDLVSIFGKFFAWMPELTLTGFGISYQEMIFSFALIGLVILSDILDETIGCYALLRRMPLPVRWLLYLCALYGVILFGVYGSLSASSFIYFNF